MIHARHLSQGKYFLGKISPSFAVYKNGVQKPIIVLTI